MTFPRRMHPGRRYTLFDRLAMSLLNAAVALPAGFLLWFLLNGTPIWWMGWLSGWFVIWFTGAMVVAGLYGENPCVGFYGWLWRNLRRGFRCAGVLIGLCDELRGVSSNRRTRRLESGVKATRHAAVGAALALAGTPLG